MYMIRLLLLKIVFLLSTRLPLRSASDRNDRGDRRLPVSEATCAGEVG